jgi:hypothetical protein
MWIKFLSRHQIERGGVPRVYNPGDWVEIGRQYALFLISTGQAEALPEQMTELLQDGQTGIVVTGGAFDAALLGDLATKIEVRLGDPSVPWRRTLMWNRKAHLPQALLPVGFAFLDVWEAACPLLPYETLARDLGDERDRCRTMETVHELRVPVYEPGLLFLRQCDASARLLELWAEEQRDGGDKRLAFLRALYRNPMLVLALPPTWLEPGYRAMED